MFSFAVHSHCANYNPNHFQFSDTLGFLFCRSGTASPPRQTFVILVFLLICKTHAASHAAFFLSYNFPTSVNAISLERLNFDVQIQYAIDYICIPNRNPTYSVNYFMYHSHTTLFSNLCLLQAA